MRTILSVLMCLAWAPMALSQIGPVKPRIVVSALAKSPPPRMALARGEQLKANIELAVDARGYVTNVTVVESSGNEEFDENLRNYYLKARLLPAIDEHGTPVAGTLKTGVGMKRPISAAHVPNPNRSNVVKKDPDKERVDGEAGRIARMGCKDFLWEFDLMKEIAGSKLQPINEELVRTSLAMFISGEKPPDAAVKAVPRALEAALLKTVKQCRASPDTPYFTGAFRPALAAELGIAVKPPKPILDDGKPVVSTRPPVTTHCRNAVGISRPVIQRIATST